MPDVRPILLSTLAALDKIHAQDKLLNTRELDAYENIRFTSKGQVCFVNPFSKESRPSVVSPLESPEGLLNPEYVTKQSDVWSFGCLFLYLLRGSHVFQGDSCPQILASVCQANLNKDGVRNLLSAICSEHVIDVISQCLQRVPSSRPSIRQILRHSFWAKEASGENMEVEIAKYFMTKVNNILSCSLRLDKSKYKENRPKGSKINKTKLDIKDGQGNIHKARILDHTGSVIRDNVLHITVDRVRLASTTVTWAAAFSQSPVKMIHIMVSINVWKNADDVNNYGKRFYANKWCDGSPITGTLSDGTFTGKIRQNFKYNISSGQLFDNFLDNHGDNEYNIDNAKREESATRLQQGRGLTAIILVRLESIIIGSAIIPLSNIGKMGVISGYYHITHQGKIMGQIMISASPTVPNILEDPTYAPVLSIPSASSRRSENQYNANLQDEGSGVKCNISASGQVSQRPCVKTRSIANIYSSGKGQHQTPPPINGACSDGSKGQEDHFLTLLKLTGGEESEASNFQKQDHEIGAGIKSKLKNIRSAVDGLKVFQREKGTVPSLKYFAAGNVKVNTINKSRKKESRWQKHHAIETPFVNASANTDYHKFTPLASSSSPSNTTGKNCGSQLSRSSPRFAVPSEIDSTIDLLNRSGSSADSPEGSVITNENEPPFTHRHSFLKPSKNFQQMQSRLEKWSAWWESQTMAEDETSLFGNDNHSVSIDDQKMPNNEKANSHNYSVSGMWWQDK